MSHDTVRRVIHGSIDVALSDPLRDWVQSRLETGDYADAGDYVRELIRRDQITSESFASAGFVADARGKIAAGFASLQAGDAVDGEAFMQQLRAGLAAQR